MSDLIVLPDVIAALTAWLAEQDEVADFATPSPRVVTQLPSSKPPDGFFIRCTQFNDRPITQTPLWFTATSVQVDVFGGPTAGAAGLARICRSLLSWRFAGIHDEITVSSVDVTGLRDEPDSTFSPARPRWLFAATIFTRPIPSVGS